MPESRGGGRCRGCGGWGYQRAVGADCGGADRGGDVVVAGAGRCREGDPGAAHQSQGRDRDRPHRLRGREVSGESDLKVVPADKGVASRGAGSGTGRPSGRCSCSAPISRRRATSRMSPPRRAPRRTRSGSPTASVCTAAAGRDRSARVTSRANRDAALVCGQHRAFALLDEEDGTSVLLLGGGGSESDAGADAGATAGASPTWETPER